MGARPLARVAGALLLVALWGCGIKGPPRPPTPAPPAAAPDGGLPRVTYRLAPPAREVGGLVLVWLAEGPVDGRARLLLERHEPHDGGDGPACGRRLVVARLRAAPRLGWTVVAGAPAARYRLLHEDGSPASEALEVPASPAAPR